MTCPTGYSDCVSPVFSSLLLFAQYCSEISVGHKCFKHTFAGSCIDCGIYISIREHTYCQNIGFVGESEENWVRDTGWQESRKERDSVLGTHT